MVQTSLFINEEPEDEYVEFKSASKGRLPKDIWEPITAFSNAEGGNIVFGVKPDGSFEELTPQELDSLQQQVVSDCSSSYNFPIHPEVTVNKGTVNAYIPPAPAVIRPIYSKSRGLPNGGRVRVGSSNVQIDSSWLQKFSVAARGGAETLEYDLQASDVLDDTLVDSYIDKVNRVRGNVYSGVDKREILEKLKVLTKEDRITLFGILAFSKGAVVQEIISPTTNIAITHYKGTSKSIPEGETQPFESNKEFFGPVTRQFEDAFSYLLSLLPIKGTIGELGKRTDYFVIPDNAIREVLANALAHRDYSVQSSRIQIDIYSDRIEFINPGKSLVPIEDLDSTPSLSRNPLLMSFLKDMGYTEQRARGIKTIKEAIKQAGLKEPIFSNNNDSFCVTLFSSAFVSDDDKLWLNRFNELKLNQRQLNALTHLRNKPSEGLTNKIYRELNNMDKVADDEKARRDINKLVEHRLLLKVGDNKSRQYFINPQVGLS